MQASTDAMRPAEDDTGSPAYWLCRHCGSPQSQALSVCLECGDRRTASGPGQRLPRGWLFAGIAVAAVAAVVALLP